MFHCDIQSRFNRGEKEIIDAMEEWVALAQEVRDLLLNGRGEKIGPLLDRNFDLRRSIYPISDGNIAMVEAARSVGASAKFTGSGGAVVGTYQGPEMFEALREKLAPLGVNVIEPQIVPDSNGAA